MEAPQFAVRKFYQAHEVVFILRQLIEKAVEWRAPHVYVMDGDIKKAYDFVSRKAFAEAAGGKDTDLTHIHIRRGRRRR